MEKVLGSEHITSRMKEHLRSGELSISEAYQIAAEREQHNEEFRLLDKRVQEAREELANAELEFYRSLRERQKRPMPTKKKEIMQRSKKEKEKIMDDIMAPFMCCIHKNLELWKP